MVARYINHGCWIINDITWEGTLLLDQLRVSRPQTRASLRLMCFGMVAYHGVTYIQ